MTVGFPAVRDYLQKLNIYKATGDVEAAQALFNNLTTVPADLLEVNKLMSNVSSKKSSRRLVVQPNLFYDPHNPSIDPTYKSYNTTFEGIVESFVDRYPEAFMSDLYRLWARDASIMRYAPSESVCVT